MSNGFRCNRIRGWLSQKVSPSVNAKLLPLPLPEDCPGCREQQRLAFRNESTLYRRKCDSSRKDIISIYSAESPYRVFEPSIWWSDDFDPLQFGQPFDFSRPFFEQFDKLNLAVPKAAIQNAKSENSEYTNYAAENKNCYLCSGAGNNEDCLYSSRVMHSKFVCDSYDVQNCESCYECVQGTFLHECLYSKNCHNSAYLIHCENCRGCRDCFGCSNLQNASFCIFNEQLEQAVYRSTVEKLKHNLGQKDFANQKIKADRTTYNFNCEDCHGNQLLNCSNCYACFTLKESKDCGYVGCAENNHDCYDCNFSDNSELQYFSTNLRHNYRVLYAALVWYSSETTYAMNCFNCNHLFGCSGMKRNEYCILNKQYTRKQYEEMLPRIVAHMRETGEWGRYFPIWLSPFPYNCSVAHEYYPLSAEQVKSRHGQWQDLERVAEKVKPAESGDPRSDVIVCSVTGKPFKITEQERKLYKHLGIDLPTKSPDTRRRERTSVIKRAIADYI